MPSVVGLVVLLANRLNWGPLVLGRGNDNSRSDDLNLAKDGDTRRGQQDRRRLACPDSEGGREGIAGEPAKSWEGRGKSDSLSGNLRRAVGRVEGHTHSSEIVDDGNRYGLNRLGLLNYTRLA